MVMKTNVHVKVIDAKKHRHLTILLYYILFYLRLSYGIVLPE